MVLVTVYKRFLFWLQKNPRFYQQLVNFLPNDKSIRLVQIEGIKIFVDKTNVYNLYQIESLRVDQIESFAQDNMRWVNLRRKKSPCEHE